MKTSHTKAPWDFKIILEWVKKAGFGDTKEQQESNARLITSTPEMAEVLKECILVYEDKKAAQPTGHLWPDSNHILHAKQVLAKAGISL